MSETMQYKKPLSYRKFFATTLVLLGIVIFGLMGYPVVSLGDPLPGQIIVDPQNPAWLKYNGGGPFFMCGPGDPEDFLYRGSRNSDGTRNGDQMVLINKLIGTGANSIYLQVIRSHGGDGDSTHNPFIDNYVSKGINMKVLDQWETWFTIMDSNRIVIFFIFYDDSASIWGGNSVGDAERVFLQTLVNRFKHHKHLIWVVAEEYGEAHSTERVKNIAAEIRAADDYDHVIAVHQNSGLDFDFPNDPNIDQFAIQYNKDSARDLHNGMITAWNNADGRYNLNMAEASGYGTGSEARKKNWAVAMGGAYVMIYEMFIEDTATSDLEDCGRLVSFMESTNFHEMSPHDELKHDGTEYVLALPGQSYIAYSSALNGKIGLKNMTAGTYDFKWFDVTNGNIVLQENVTVAAGDQAWSNPSGISNELAVYIKRIGESSNTAPTAHSQNVTVIYQSEYLVTLSYTDPDGPGPYTIEVTQSPLHGMLSGNGMKYLYIPDMGFSGSDLFRWKVNDGINDSNNATVLINVTPQESSPIAPPTGLSRVK